MGGGGGGIPVSPGSRGMPGIPGSVRRNPAKYVLTCSWCGLPRACSFLALSELALR